MKRNKFYGIMAMLIAVMMLMSTIPAMANTVIYGETLLIDGAGNAAYGITGVDRHYTSNGNVTATPAADIGDGTTALKLDIDSSSVVGLYSKIGHLSDTTVDMTYINFDIYAPNVDLSKVEIGFGVDKDAFITNTISVGEYAETSDGWQSVSLPLADFSETGLKQGNPVEWSYNDGIYTIIKNTGEAPYTIYVKNLKLETKQDEVYDYSYEGDGMIQLIENGDAASGLTVGYNANNSEELGNIGKNVEIDGRKAVRFRPNTTSKMFAVGTTGLYADVTSTKDYTFVMDVKFAEKHAYPLELIATNGPWDAVPSINFGTAGFYFKQTDDWQTVEIPLSDFADHSMSGVFGIGLRAVGPASTANNQSNDQLAGANGSYLPVMYISDMKLVPNNCTKYNKLATEKVSVNDYFLYKGGLKDNGTEAVMGVDYNVYNEYLGQVSVAELPVTDGNNHSQYGAAGLQISSNKWRGIAFNIADAGITAENCENKYLSFEICNGYGGNNELSILRDMTYNNDWHRDSMANFASDGKYEKTTVRYDPTLYKMTKVVVPLNSISQKVDTLSWSDTPWLAIAFEKPGSQWDMFYLDNVRIGEFIDGTVVADAPSLSIDRDEYTAKISANVTNTMTAAYKYTDDSVNIIAIRDMYDNERVIKVKTVDIAGATVAAGATTEVVSETVELGNLGEWLQVNAYKWSDLENLVPSAQPDSEMVMIY